MPNGDYKVGKYENSSDFSRDVFELGAVALHLAKLEVPSSRDADGFRREVWTLPYSFLLKRLLLRLLDPCYQPEVEDVRERVRWLLFTPPLEDKDDCLYGTTRELEEAERMLLSQLQSLHTAEVLQERDIASVQLRLAFLYKALNKDELAVQFAEQSLALRMRVLGETHLDTAEVQSAMLEIRKDSAENALKCLRTQQVQLGNCHMDVATTYMRLASIYDRDGQDAELQEAFQHFRRIRLQVFGERNPATAELLNNEMCYFEGEVRKQAMTQLATFTEEELGGRSMGTAIVVFVLGQYFVMMNSLAEAETCLEQAATLALDLRGEDEDIVRQALSLLAETRLGLGKHSAAVEAGLKALRCFKKDDPQVARLTKLLLLASQNDAELTGQVEEALKLVDPNIVQQGRNSLQQQIEAAHYAQLADLSFGNGDFSAAKTHAFQSLSLFKKLFGADDENVAESFYSLCGICLAQGDFAGSEEYGLKCVEILERLPPSHPLLARVYLLLASLFQGCRRASQLETYAKKCLALPQLSNDETVQTLELLADAYYISNRVAEAYEQLEKACAVKESVELYKKLLSVGLALGKGKEETTEKYMRKYRDLLEQKLGSSHPEVQEQLFTLSHLLLATGKLTQAADTARQHLAVMRTTLPADHPHVLRASDHLSNVLFKMGHVKEAEEVTQQSNSDPRTAEQLLSKADHSIDAGRFQEAEQLALKALALLKPENPEVKNVYHVFANLYQKMGRFAEAEKYGRKVVELAKTEGDESAMSNAYINLSTTLNSAGRSSEAIKYCLQGLEIDIAKSGEWSLEAGIIYNNLSQMYMRTDELQKAAELGEKALRVSQMFEGLPVGTMYLNLSQVYLQLRQLQKAEEYARKGYDLQLPLLGEKHPIVGTALNNLALVLLRMGRLAEAEQYMVQCIGVLTATLGVNHPNTASSIGTLGTIYKKQGRFKDAIAYCKKCYAIELALLGERHPETIASCFELAKTLHKAMLSKEAEPYALQVVAMLDNTHNTDKVYKLLVKIYARQGKETEMRRFAQLIQSKEIDLRSVYKMLMQQGRLPEAEEVLQECLRIAKTKAGEESVAVADLLYDLAGLCSQQKKQSDRLLYTQECLRLRLKLLGDHDDTANVYNCIYVIHLEQGNYAEAEVAIREYIRIETIITGEDSVQTLLGHYHLSHICQFTNRPAEALEGINKYLKLVHNTFSESIGEKHKDVADIYMTISHLNLVLNRLPEAEAATLKAIGILREVFGDSHENTAVAHNRLAEVYLGMERLDDALQHSSQCIEILEALHSPQVADAYRFKAKLFFSRGCLAEAEAEELKSLNFLLQKPEENALAIAAGRFALSKLCRKMGRLEDALKYAIRFAGSLRRMLGEKHPHVAIADLNLSNIYQAMGRLPEAEVWAKKSAEVLGTTRAEGAHALLALSKISLAMDKREEARTFAQQAVLTAEQLELKELDEFRSHLQLFTDSS